MAFPLFCLSTKGDRKRDDDPHFADNGAMLRHNPRGGK
jgi:hypothetical protein